MPGRLFRAVAAVLAAAVLAACGAGGGSPVVGADPGGGPGPGAFAAAVPGTDAFVAVVADPSGALLGYVCDSAGSAAWFRGGLDAQGAARAVATTGERLDVVVDGSGAVGTVTLAGVARPFTAEPVYGDAGLFRAELTARGVPALAGWIRLADGTQRGAVIVDELTGPRIGPAPLLPGRTPVITVEDVVVEPEQITPSNPFPPGLR